MLDISEKIIQFNYRRSAERFIDVFDSCDLIEPRKQTCRGCVLDQFCNFSFIDVEFKFSNDRFLFAIPWSDK